MDNDFVLGLIKKDKYILNKTRPKFQEINRSYRMNIDLKSDDDKLKYTMFIRQTTRFAEDFSVGLRIDPPNQHFTTAMTLLRFQGPHGGQSEDGMSLHNSFHMHRLTEADVALGRYKPRCAPDEVEYSGMEEAIVSFLDYCNIKDPYGIFDEERDMINQIKMDLPL